MGVIRNRLGMGDGELPVVWCEQCQRAYFQRPFCMAWDRCQVHPHSIIFEKDPEKINANIKLEYSVTLTPETQVPLYTIYKAL